MSNRILPLTSLFILIALLILLFTAGCNEDPPVEPNHASHRLTNSDQSSTQSNKRDLFLTQALQVPSNEPLQVHNLVIAEGATLFSSGNLIIHSTGDVRIDGTVRAEADLVLILEGGLDYAATASVEVGRNCYIVSQPDLLPTEQQMEEFISTLEQKGSIIATGLQPLPSRSGTAFPAKRIRENTVQFFHPVWLPPVKFKDSTGGVWWIHLLGQINIGKKPNGPPVTYTLPHGKSMPTVTGCNARGKNGGRGGSIIVQATGIRFYGPVTINLGDGGKGGNATANNCCPAVAYGGRGGKPGRFAFITPALSPFGLSTGIQFNGQCDIFLGNGGAGGNALAIAQDRGIGCPGERGCDATAIGGDGGGYSNARVRYWGNISGLNNVTIHSGNGGKGGAAEATAGAGGNGNNNDCCAGGDGGNAFAQGGKGGDYRLTIPAPIQAGAPGVGGDGGNATAFGGKGGDATTSLRCCFQAPPTGQNGGNGGNAEAQAGKGGIGDGANGWDGAVGGKGGDGGNGSWGAPPGNGGNGGRGTNVPNGRRGNDGQPC